MSVVENLGAIVAVCDDWGIGEDGDMVVANRADMRHFVRCTTGRTVIMGRRTLATFPGARPLKNRRNIVLTRDRSLKVPGAEVAHSVEEALSFLASGEEAWVVGGGVVYREFLPFCARAVVTHNHCLRSCDTFFPDLGNEPGWVMTSQTEPMPIGAGEGDEGVLFSFAEYRQL